MTLSSGSLPPSVNLASTLPVNADTGRVPGLEEIFLEMDVMREQALGHL